MIHLTLSFAPIRVEAMIANIEADDATTVAKIVIEIEKEKKTQ